MRKKVRPYLQVTQTECGLCVARSMLHYHGRELSLPAIREVLEPGRDGLSLKEIGRVLGTFGLRTNMYRVKDVRGLDTLQVPFIAYWKGYHFVVVERLGEDSAVIVDPMAGRVTITREELEEEFTEYVMTATPGETFERKSLPVLWEWRNKPIWPRDTKPYYAGLIAVSILLFALSLSIPKLTQHLIDADDPADLSIGKLVLSVAAVAVAFWLFQLIRANVTTTIVERASWSLMNQTFSHLMRLPIRYFTTRPPGELVYRLSSLNGVRDLIAYRISQGALDLVTALILLAYVYSVSWQLALVLTGLCVVVIALLTLSRRLSNSAMDEEVNYAGRSQAMQLDGIVSVSSIRMGTYVGDFLKEWRGLYQRAVAAMGRRMRIQNSRIGSAVTSVQMFGPLLVMAIGLHWVQSGQLTLGEAVASQTVAALVLSMGTSIYQCITEAMVASKYLERVDDVFSMDVEPPGGSRRELPDTSIALRDVDFAYTENSPLTLRSISLDIAARESVAVVGESGSGKTTLGKIICSLYEVSAGELTYGDIPVDEFHRDSLRSRIGYIPQECHLHNRTIVENLTIGSALPKDEAIRRSRELGFLEFVDDLPMGYHTVVSEMGANFSAGQRQRLAIAKALLRDPSILILDEATSALDNISQRRVHEAVAERACTQIIIAHRLSTVMHADRTFVMHDGEIVESGSHEELVDRNGYYTELYGADRVVVE